jgi:hypothetical protein
MEQSNAEELLQDRVAGLDVALEAMREERDRLRSELEKVCDDLVTVTAERDQLRSDVSRLRLALAQGSTED